MFAWQKCICIIEILQIQVIRLAKFSVKIPVRTLRVFKKKLVAAFGFKMQTSCGEIAYPNEWKKSWIEFFFKNRLEFVIGKIENQELNELFEKLRSKKDRLFDGAKE